MVDTASHGSGGSGGTGDLYGDLWVLTRDFDPSDGGGDGAPVLDENGQPIPIGWNPETGELFPIHLVEGTEGDWEVPPALEPYVQEVELERANIIRSPDSVVENALDEALGKIEAGTEIAADPSGRIAVDGVLIDSPRECLALYKLIMTAGGATSWTEAQANASELPAKLQDLLATGWNPTGLLAGVFNKFVPVDIDAVLTAHTLMEVNEVDSSGPTTTVDYYSFLQDGGEAFDYDRKATFGDVWVRWYQDIDGDPSDLEAVTRTLYDLAWGRDRNGDGINDVGSGVDWVDEALALTPDGLGYERVPATSAGVNDWAQSVEDHRAAIYVLHEFVGAEQVEAPGDEDELILGGPTADLLAGWGGDDTIIGYGGDDTLEGGDGDDILKANAGDDTLDGGRGEDVMRGGRGDDVLYRGGGADRMFGGDGNDRMAGGFGADAMDGGDGDDRLVGGRGADRMIGGEGADRFVFMAPDAEVVDVVEDFRARLGDLVHLARIDADASSAEDDAFGFIGYAAFSGDAGELRAVDLGRVQRIEGDVDGDGAADLVVELATGGTAVESWFVL
ncbi:Hemolysin-type calcium-binding repeat-containing protein [Albimonas pacifica]|uniref:Hemolysin-type calcium-binding repeat-containing protein n=2 Tax=Albimonas pacifica TaxID=1114924 RepID=A0A1I3NUA0_9RHOB|nr:Hemolysin-type calcium-binding repeat-containing protein [Albimonas pacifica]